MDITDTTVFIISIVDGIALLFLTVYFVSFIMWDYYKMRKWEWESLKMHL